MRSVKEAVRDILASKGLFIHRGRTRGLSLFNEIGRALEYEQPLTFFDVGANQGDVAVQLASRWPYSQVFCFEPSPSVLPKLRQTATRFKPRIEVIEYGVGDEITWSNFFETSNQYTGSFQNRNDQGETRKIADVPLTTIDAFCESREIEKIDFLKIDTEGFDYNVLKGGRDMLSHRRVRMVQVEASFSAINSVHAHFREIISALPKDFQIFGFYEQVPEYQENLHLRRANVVFFNSSLF